LVSEIRRAIRMPPESVRIVAIDHLASILDGDDDDAVEDDLIVSGRVIQRMDVDATKRHATACDGPSR